MKNNDQQFEGLIFLFLIILSNLLGIMQFMSVVAGARVKGSGTESNDITEKSSEFTSEVDIEGVMTVLSQGGSSAFPADVCVTEDACIPLFNNTCLAQYRCVDLDRYTFFRSSLRLPQKSVADVSENNRNKPVPPVIDQAFIRQFISGLGREVQIYSRLIFEIMQESQEVAKYMRLIFTHLPEFRIIILPESEVKKASKILSLSYIGEAFYVKQLKMIIVPELPDVLPKRSTLRHEFRHALYHVLNLDREVIKGMIDDGDQKIEKIDELLRNTHRSESEEKYLTSLKANIPLGYYAEVERTNTDLPDLVNRGYFAKDVLFISVEYIRKSDELVSQSYKGHEYSEERDAYLWGYIHPILIRKLYPELFEYVNKHIEEKLSEPILHDLFLIPQRRFGSIFELFAMFAERGEPDSQYNLAIMYHRGIEVEENHIEAARWFRLAAERGHAPAQDKLGEMYYRGDGVEKSFVEAIKYFKLAVKQKYTPSLFNLATMYYKGEGVKQNYVEAARLFRSAAEQGNAPSQCNLGMMYYYGQGVEKNLAEAVRWFRLAAEQNYAQAQFNLAVYYEHVEQNLIEAQKWYKLAKKQNYPGAKEGYKRIGASKSTWDVKI